jgi:hypothetical protein
MCWSVLFFEVLSDDGRAPGSLRVVNVALSSLKIRNLFLAFHSFITPPPYTATSWRKFQSDGQIVHSKNRITARTSHSAGFWIFLFNFKYYKKSQNVRISASFTWHLTKRLLRLVNLEMVQFVDLRKCYAQTVFTFWSNLRNFIDVALQHPVARHLFPVFIPRLTCKLVLKSYNSLSNFRFISHISGALQVCADMVIIRRFQLAVGRILCSLTVVQAVFGENFRCAWWWPYRSKHVVLHIFKIRNWIFKILTQLKQRHSLRPVWSSYIYCLHTPLHVSVF